MTSLLEIAVMLLGNIVAEARLTKQCPEYDGCNICKAEELIEHVEGNTALLRFKVKHADPRT